MYDNVKKMLPSKQLKKLGWFHSSPTFVRLFILDIEYPKKYLICSNHEEI